MDEEISKVINISTGQNNPLDYIYVGRPSVFGNPFIIGIDGSRKDVLNKFIDWILGKNFTNFKQEQRQQLIEKLPTLKNKILGCFCTPLPCHGLILQKLIEGKIPKYYLNKNYSKEFYRAKAIGEIELFNRRIDKGIISCPLCGKQLFFKKYKMKLIGKCTGKNCISFIHIYKLRKKKT